MWTGSAFSCGTTNEIILRHDLFSNSTTGVCNNGAIVARSIGVVNDSYTSQLEVTVNSGFNNNTVKCNTVISDTGVSEIGRITITVISGTLDKTDLRHVTVY